MFDNNWINFPLFDANVLSEMVGNDPTTHRRLLQKFLDSTQAKLPELLRASAARDTVISENIAHTLKSSARSAGALRLGELCGRLEQAGKSGDSKACQNLGEFLNVIFAETAEAISKQLDN